MPKSQAVAQHLPALRRYARALSGSQVSGDHYVSATLEALVRDPGILDQSGVAPKVALYRAFTRLWNSVPLNEGVGSIEHDLPADRRLAQMTSRPRQAFLLVALEGFQEQQAAEILDIDEDTLAELVAQSGRELAAEIATTVLIIEDEPLIAMNIDEVVSRLGHRVIGVARTHGEAVALAKAQKPGLILADIQLADGSSGLDAVNQLLEAFEVPVIFITAYPERFLTGERPEPAFLIPKPFQPTAVSAIISQALFFEQKARPNKQRATA